MDFNPKLASEMRAVLMHDDSLRGISEALKAKWRMQSPKRESGDETMYALGHQDGMVEAIDLFLQEIEAIAHSK